VKSLTFDVESCDSAAIRRKTKAAKSAREFRKEWDETIKKRVGLGRKEGRTRKRDTSEGKEDSRRRRHSNHLLGLLQPLDDLLQQERLPRSCASSEEEPADATMSTKKEPGQLAVSSPLPP